MYIRQLYSTSLSMTSGISFMFFKFELGFFGIILLYQWLDLNSRLNERLHRLGT
jgi:hypothetical protein